MSLSTHSIGQVANMFDVSAHTLRYYEKIGLLAPIAKDAGGRRRFDNNDIQRLKFIRRAQHMRFSLDEIRQLIAMDKNYEDASGKFEKAQVRTLVTEKLSEINSSLKQLTLLQKDLKRMLHACQASEDEECPIIEGIKDKDDT